MHQPRCVSARAPVPGRLAETAPFWLAAGARLLIQTLSRLPRPTWPSAPKRKPRQHAAQNFFKGGWPDVRAKKNPPSRAERRRGESGKRPNPTYIRDWMYASLGLSQGTHGGLGSRLRSEERRVGKEG